MTTPHGFTEFTLGSDLRWTCVLRFGRSDETDPWEVLR